MKISTNPTFKDIVSLCTWYIDSNTPDEGFYRTYNNPYKYIITDIKNINMKIVIINTCEVAERIINNVGPFETTISV